MMRTRDKHPRSRKARSFASRHRNFFDEPKINAFRCNATSSAAAQCHTEARVLKARVVLRSHSIVNPACARCEDKQNSADEKTALCMLTKAAFGGIVGR
jgi:hypothetical protein